MQPFDDNLDGYYDVEDQLPQYIRARAERQFAAAERARDHIRSRKSVEQRGHRAQSAFFEAIGGLPTDETPLNPNRTGIIERDDYRIELIVLESLPDFHVTTNLYGPKDIDGEAPAILFLCGHSQAAKAGELYQQACIDLVQNGFVVLAVDPLGQGERHQFYDPETDTLSRRNTREHAYLAHQCMFAGTNVARYFVWDAIRSLDYLESRPDVDADRIGVTGNSGGGLQTAYMMLADDRPAAVAPCCFITDREAYMKTGQAQDGEQIIYRAIDRGPWHDDFFAAFAPKPAMIGAKQSDFFCIEGAHRTYERACDLYDHFDARDALDLTVAAGTHGLTAELRQAVVNWFRKHLRGVAPDFTTGDPPTEDPDELQCVTQGEVIAAYDDERTVVDLDRAEVARLNPETPAKIEGDKSYDDILRERVRQRFDLDRNGGSLYPRTYAEEQTDGLIWEKVFFLSEPEIVTTGILARRTDYQKQSSEPTVVLLERGTNEFADYRDDVAALAERRGLAFIFDPRGIGGVRSRDVNTQSMNGGEYYEHPGTLYKLASDALMTGSSLIALQVFDVVRAAEYLRNRCGDVPLGIVGAGTGAINALYASVAEPAFQSVLIDDVPSFYERATTNEIPFKVELNIHDVIGSLDVPQLLPALDDRTVEQTPFPDDGLPM